MRNAMVVFPVPGRPVKHMCSDGGSVERPIRSRSRSTSNSAAICRMRSLTGSSPINSRSNSSSTASRLDSRSAASTSTIASMVTSLLGTAAITLAFRPIDGIGMNGVPDTAARGLLAFQPEARFPGRPVHDEGQCHGLPAPGCVVRIHFDVAVRVSLAAGRDFLEHRGGAGFVEHGGLPHLPIGVARMRVVRIFDADGPALAHAIVDLGRYLYVGQLGQERKRAL